MEHLRNAGLPQYPSHGKVGSSLDCCVISATGVEERSLIWPMFLTSFCIATVLFRLFWDTGMVDEVCLWVGSLFHSRRRSCFLSDGE